MSSRNTVSWNTGRLKTRDTLDGRELFDQRQGIGMARRGHAFQTLRPEQRH